MMTDVFLSVIEISIVTGGIAAVCMVLLPILNKRFAAKWSYYIWIFLAVRLLIPVNMQTISQAAGQIVEAFKEKPEAQQKPVEAARQRIVIEVPPAMTAPIATPGAAPEEKRATVTVLDLAAFVWAFGCVVSLLFPICSYLFYRRRMLHEACARKDETLFAQMDALQKELHVKRTLPVLFYDGDISPMIMGAFRPVIILPENRYSEQELYFILKHELIHLKRHDVAVKFLFVAAGALHWFNPAVYLMKRRAVIDMELSCDERVIRGIAYADRKAYTETLLSTIQEACGKRTFLSTQFYGGKEIMKRRFLNIFTRVRKKNGMPFLLVAAALTLTAGTFVSCGVSDTGAGGSFPPVVMWTGSGDAQAEDEGMSDEELCERAKQYFAAHHSGMIPQAAEVDGVTDEGLVKIHLYDIAEDNSATMTLDWYTVDRKTGIGEDVNFEPVNLLESTVQTNEPAKEELLHGQATTPETETTLTFLKEGMEEKKQAELVNGSGFGLFLPVGEWQMSAPGQWTSTVNGLVRIWVTQFQTTSQEEVWKELAANGYPFENGELLQENGAEKLKIKLFESVAGDKIWGVFYSYPTEAEEGWGQELPVIADTFFEASTDHYTVQDGASDSKALSETAEAFAAAYFAGDADALGAYLADTFEGKAETYSGPGTVTVMAVRGPGTDEELPVGSKKDISIEFQDSTEDSYTYLTLGFVKQADGWKVQWYGLEK